MTRIRLALLTVLLFGFIGTANAVPVTLDVFGLGAKWDFDGPMSQSGSCLVCGTLDPSPQAATYVYDLSPGSYVFRIAGFVSSYDLFINGHSIVSGGGLVYFNTYDIMAVPEPGILTLMALGLIGFWLARVRKP